MHHLTQSHGEAEVNKAEICLVQKLAVVTKSKAKAERSVTLEDWKDLVIITSTLVCSLMLASRANGFTVKWQH